MSFLILSEECSFKAALGHSAFGGGVYKDFLRRFCTSSPKMRSVPGLVWHNNYSIFVPIFSIDFLGVTFDVDAVMLMPAACWLLPLLE
jgi:hypothetical protein